MELQRRFYVRVLIALTTAVPLLATAFGVSALFQPSTARAVASVPYLINFQGRLADNSGNVLADGTYNVKFRIFDAATSGTNRWEGDRVMGASDYRVTVQNGLFNIQFGDTAKGDPVLSAALFNTQTYANLYLEAELPTPVTATCATNGCAVWTEGAMTPRQPLASSPYAFNSDVLDGLDSSDFGQITAANTFTGTNTFSKVGGVGLVLSGSAASGGSILQVGSALSSGSTSGTLIGANGAFTGDLLNLQVSNTTKLKVDNSGNLTLASGAVIAIGASTGAGTTCSGGQVLQNQTTVGGIVTGGSCATPAGTGANTTLGNLGTTSINASLIPGSNNTLDLGTAAAVWAHTYTALVDAGSTTTTLGIGTGSATAVSVGRAAATFALASTGLNVTTTGAISGGTTYSGSGNINTTGGTIQTNSTDRITNGGALTNITGYTQTSGTHGITSANTSGNVLSLADTALNTNGSHLADFSFTNANSTSTSTAVSGLSITPAGAANANSNANTLVALLFPNVTPVANNAFHGLSFGTGYNDILRLTSGTSIINGSGQVNGAQIQSGTIANGGLTNNSITINGTGISGGGTVALGGTLSLATVYGSTSNTAVQGNTTLICPTASGNLTGGAGNTITLGAGGTCNAIGIVNNPSFTTSVTSPSFTGTGAVSVASGTATALTLDSANGTLLFGANTATLQKAAAAFAVDLATAGTSTLTVKNSNGANVANLTVTGAIGGAAITGTSLSAGSGAVTGGTSTLTGANALTLGTTGTSTGAILFKGATAASASLTLQGPANPTTNTLTLPNETGTLCSSASGSTTCTGNFIINSSSTQTGNFHITGTGAAPTLQAYTFDTPDNTQAMTIGGTNATLGITIGSTSGATPININTGSGGINIGDTATTKTIDIGGVANSGTDTVNIATNNTAADTVTIGSTNAASKVVLTGGVSTTTSGTAGVIIGSAGTDTNQVNLQLDSYSTFADSGTCSTTVNQGALYYNTGNNAIRGCINGGWEDLISTAGLGIMLYGVVPDSGSGNDPGDLASLSTPGKSGPCKVSAATASTVNIQGCVLYSGGRKRIVATNTAFAVTLSATNIWVHICMNNTAGNENTPLATVATTEVAGLPSFSINNPITCLADVKVNGTAIQNVYDVRPFTTSIKEFVTVTTAAVGMGDIVIPSTSHVIMPGTVTAAQSVRGVVLSSLGATSTTTPGAIIAVAGPVVAKATAGTAGAIVTQGIATNGYAVTGGATTNTYSQMGYARKTFPAVACGTTLNAANCDASLYFSMSLR
ncbi:MAG: hypothetical protein JWN01_373 [Patescibacteria group bacterium]|nr:hypothetical protein [Patescibacteria group bacterium]